MLEQLLQLDREVFSIINEGLSNRFFDTIMPLLRNRFFWFPLYLFLIIFFVRNYGKKGWMIIIFMALTFALTDSISSSIIKPAVERLRPCNDPGMKASINILIACGSGFSFPSSHAANHFGMAFFLVLVFYRKWKPIAPLAILWAASVSFAQIYVGVHFPIDILAGTVLGYIIAVITSTILLHTEIFKGWKLST